MSAKKDQYLTDARFPSVEQGSALWSVADHSSIPALLLPRAIRHVPPYLIKRSLDFTTFADLQSLLFALPNFYRACFLSDVNTE